MSTIVSGMQSSSTRQPHFELDFDMMSKPSSMYGSSNRWATPPQVDHSHMDTTDYLGFPVGNARPSDDQFTLRSKFQQSSPNDRDIRNEAASKRSFDDFNMQSGMNAPLGVPATSMYSSPAVFATNNVQMSSYGPATISPLDTSFDMDHASPVTNTKLSLDSHVHHSLPTDFTSFNDDNEPLSSRRRCDSQQSGFESHSPTIPQAQVGRRRGSEYAEPGSARAVYLEKNRKAASKCRSKQKRQQEELVETARDLERRNKILKVEIEMLKSGMRDLMELVGQHTNCPDARLRLYVQREADRLAIGGQRNAISSPLSGCARSGPSSTDRTSSPEDE